MRRTPGLALAALLVAMAATTVQPVSAAVILSELCDPLLNYTTDRYIEIYNTGPGSVDLTGWKIVAVGNGVDVNTWTLSGTIGPNEAKVASSTAPVTVFPIHYASASWLTNYFNWNGKVGDGAKLVNASNVVIDNVLAPGTLFENQTLVRLPSVAAPTAVFNRSEWDTASVTLATNATPGSHNGSTPPAAGPRITDIVTDPASPASGNPVDVQATVIDTSSTIQAVTLSWGTAAGNLANVIGMPLLSGDTYRTSSSIPGQASGVTIYYRLLAESDSASTQSAILNYTIPGGGTGVPPSVLAVGEMSDSTFLVFFSETVEEASAEVPTNYTIGALSGVAAVRDSLAPAQVLVTIRGVAAGNRTLAVNGVADLEGNYTANATRSFNYVNVQIPAGYYDSAIGLSGSALRVALHNRIKNHTVGSYSAALTAFQTTDVKPNGKVWDMYSDIPGGTPPYEYSFGQTGSGVEGAGYNREHSFPSSWFNGDSPMYSDLWILYPTDAYVNGMRSNYPYGEVGDADEHVAQRQQGRELGLRGLLGHRVRAHRRLQGRPGARPVLRRDALFRPGRRVARQRLVRRRRDVPVGRHPVPRVVRRRSGQLEGAHAQRRGLRHPGQPQPLHRSPRVPDPHLRLDLGRRRRRRGGRRGLDAAPARQRAEPVPVADHDHVRPGAPRAGVARRLRRHGPAGPRADRRRGRAPGGRPCRRVERPRRQRPAGRGGPLLRAAPGPGRHGSRSGRNPADGRHALKSNVRSPPLVRSCMRTGGGVASPRGCDRLSGAGSGPGKGRGVRGETRARRGLSPIIQHGRLLPTPGRVRKDPSLFVITMFSRWIA